MFLFLFEQNSENNFLYVQLEAIYHKETSGSENSYL